MVRSAIAEPPPPWITLALRALGYDVSVPEPAILAFKRHFVPDETTPEFTDRDRSVLHCLLSQATE